MIPAVFWVLGWHLWLASRSQLKFGNCASGSRGSAPLTTTNLSNPQQISTNPHHIILEFRVLLCHHSVYLNSKIQTVYRIPKIPQTRIQKAREIAESLSRCPVDLRHVLSHAGPLQVRRSGGYRRREQGIQGAASGGVPCRRGSRHSRRCGSMRSRSRRVKGAARGGVQGAARGRVQGTVRVMCPLLLPAGRLRWAATESPTDTPTETPTESPTDLPTNAPTESPTESPAAPNYSDF